MKTTKYILSLSLTLGFLTACSDDSGDKEEKGKSKLTSAVLVSEKCAAQNDFRNQCYHEIMKNSPEAIESLAGNNPFLLKSWDKADFSKSQFQAEVEDCRASFPDLCQ